MLQQGFHPVTAQGRGHSVIHAQEGEPWPFPTKAELPHTETARFKTSIVRAKVPYKKGAGQEKVMRETDLWKVLPAEKAFEEKRRRRRQREG